MQQALVARTTGRGREDEQSRRETPAPYSRRVESNDVDTTQLLRQHYDVGRGRRPPDPRHGGKVIYLAPEGRFLVL